MPHFRDDISQAESMLPRYPAATRQLRETGEYSDCTVICDDGVTFKLHKFVICSHVEALRLAFQDKYIEGQTNTYPIREHSSVIVDTFFDIIYGKPLAIKESSDSDYDFANPEILGQLLLLADELQAKDIVIYLCSCFQWKIKSLDFESLAESLEDVEEIAAAQPLFELLISSAVSHFRHDYTVDENVCKFLSLYSQHGIKVVKKLCEGNPRNEVVKLIKQEEWEPVLQTEGVLYYLLKEYKSKGPWGKWDIDTIYEMEEFCNAASAGDHIKAFFKAFKSDITRRLGKDILMWCSACKAVISTSDKHMRNCPACNRKLTKSVVAEKVIRVTGQDDQGNAILENINLPQRW